MLQHGCGIDQPNSLSKTGTPILLTSFCCESGGPVGAESECNDSDASSFAVENYVGGEDPESSSNDAGQSESNEDESDFLHCLGPPATKRVLPTKSIYHVQFCAHFRDEDAKQND